MSEKFEPESFISIDWNDKAFFIIKEIKKVPAFVI